MSINNKQRRIIVKKYKIMFQGERGHTLMIIPAENNIEARKIFNKNISIREDKRYGKKNKKT